MSRVEALAIVRDEAGILRSKEAGMRTNELPVVFVGEVDDGAFSVEEVRSYSAIVIKGGKGGIVPATFAFREKVPFENVIYIRFRPRNGWIQLCETTHTRDPFFMACPDWKSDPARKDRLLSALLVLCPNVR